MPFNVHCILDTVYCTLYNVCIILYTVYCIMYNVNLIQYNVYCILILYTIYYILYIVYCTLCHGARRGGLSAVPQKASHGAVIQKKAPARAA